MPGHGTARGGVWYPECMFWLIYLLSAILCIWGGCLLARVIANRLELGLFRRKQRKEAVEAAGASSGTTASAAGMPEVKKRSGWWTAVGVGVLALGGGVTFVSDAAMADISGSSLVSQNDITGSLLVAVFVMSLGLSGGLVVVGWRFDPSLGRRRCPKCWYDLSATKGLLCTECGNEVSSERQLRRSRRSRLTMVMALLPILLVPIVQRGLYTWKVGWVGLLPTSVMVIAWEWLPDDIVGAQSSQFGWGTGARGTLFDRVDKNEMWEWQRALLKWRLANVVHSSDDVRTIHRAICLHELGGRSDLDIQSPLATRFDELAAKADWSDPASLPGLSWLVSSLDYARTAELSAAGRQALLANCQKLLPHVARTLTRPDDNAMFVLTDARVFPLLTESEAIDLEHWLVDTSTTGWVRDRIARCMAKGGGPRSVRVTKAVLESVTTRVQGEALRGLCTTSESEPIALIAEHIRTADAKAVDSIVSLLAYTDDEHIQQAIATRFSIDGFMSPEFRRTLTMTLQSGMWRFRFDDLLLKGLERGLRHPDEKLVVSTLQFVIPHERLWRSLRTPLEDIVRDKSPGDAVDLSRSLLQRLDSLPVPATRDDGLTRQPP